MSSALEVSAAAAPPLSLSYGATGRTVPSTSACGQAMSPARFASAKLVAVPVIARGTSRRSRTTSSQRLPVIASITSPAAR